MGGHIVEVPKAIIGQLLLAASFVETHDFHCDGVAKVRRMGVIKGDVTIVTNPAANEIDRFLFDQGNVVEADLVRVASLFAGNEVEPVSRDVGPAK